MINKTTTPTWKPYHIKKGPETQAAPSTPNYTLRRLGALASAIAAGVLVAGGFNAVTHQETVGFKTVQIPSANPQEGFYPGEVTHEAICIAAAEVVDNADLPPGITEEDKGSIKASCVDAADNAIEGSGPAADITGETVKVTLNKDFLGDYHLSAETEEDK